MRLKAFMKSSGIAALAVSLAVVAIPSAASAEPGDRGGRGGWQGQSENRGGGEGRGGWNRGGEAAQAQAPAPQPRQAPQQAQPQPRNWGGDRNGDRPGRGWGSQRPAEGQRYGREGAVVNRPEPSWRDNTPRQAPAAEVQRRDGERNRSYSDQNRDRTYNRDAQRQQGWDGRQWQGQNSDRNWDRDRRDRNTPRQQGWDGRQWQGQNSDRNWDRDRGRDRDARNPQRWHGDRSGNWSRDWRRDNRYNWQSWRNSNRDVYRLGRYNPPYRSYSYRRLSTGFYLDSLFFGSNYWINDPYMYRLPPAYGPYRWVRYYDDALLVNIYDGEVVDVIYDFFW